MEMEKTPIRSAGSGFFSSFGLRASWQDPEASRIDSQLSIQQPYTRGDLELWFALSAFADNASLYEQIVNTAGNPRGRVGGMCARECGASC